MSRNTNGKYVLYKTITSNSTTSFRDKGVMNGRAYYYQIRAYRAIKKNTYYSSPSTIRCVAGLNAVNFKTDTRLSRVNLTWGKAMTTPTAYEIFYSTSKNGKYTKLGETKNTFYNTKSLQSARPITSVFVLTSIRDRAVTRKSTSASAHSRQRV